MAFNDLRRANAQGINTTFVHDNDSRAAQKNTTLLPPNLGFANGLRMLRNESATKERYREKTIKKQLQEELEYDKMMQERLRLGSMDTTKKTETAQGPSRGATQIKIVDNTDDDYDKSFAEENQILL